MKTPALIGQRGCFREAVVRLQEALSEAVREVFGETTPQDRRALLDLLGKMIS